LSIPGKKGQLNLSQLDGVGAEQELNGQPQ